VPSLKAVIRFEGHNLAGPLFPMLTPGTLDLIMCRNVIIYFDQPTIRALMDRFFDALRPGGVLLLGYSESLFRMATRFEMFEVCGTFAYRRPMIGVVHTPGSPSAPPLPSASAPRPSAPLPAARPSAPLTNAIPRQSGVYPALGRRTPASGSPVFPSPNPSAPNPPRPSSPPTPPPSAPESRRTPVERLDKVVALIEKGDFGQALLGARRLADDQPEDLAALLTLGNIHALMGNVDEARDLFNSALAKEPLCVEARVYLAVAAIQSGQSEEARIELTRALFLEPTLALGHYLLAQVQEKLGDLEAARRSYKNAIAQRRAVPHTLLGHFPELPTTNDAIAQAARYRLAALSEA
jgi:chemotaxis protein methyltransferase CheR